MKREKPEPIAERSRRWLTEALLALMAKEDYRDITIQEIADRAGLSRRTFYRNFATKDEVLVRCAQTLREEYVAFLQGREDLSLPSIARLHFAFWQKRLTVIDTLRKGGMFHLVLAMYNEFLPGLYRQFKEAPGGYESQKQLDYALAFSAGGFWNMLDRWLSLGAKESPEEMADTIRKAILNFASSR
jgi:AcrR family transcriptional regulator